MYTLEKYWAKRRRGVVSCLVIKLFFCRFYIPLPHPRIFKKKKIYIYILKTADRTVSACWASSVQCRNLGKADTNVNIYALPGAPSLWARKRHAMPECSNHRGSELYPGEEHIYIYIFIF